MMGREVANNCTEVPTTGIITIILGMILEEPKMGC